MQLKEIGELIAIRNLYVLNDDKAQVQVKLGRPAQFPDGTDYYCPYQVTGAGDDKVRYAAGVDAFQAIELALKVLGADLNFKYQRALGGRLRWECDETGGLGFPVPEP